MSSDKKVAISVKGITKTFRIPLDKGVGVKAKVLGRATRGYREFTPLNDITFDVYEGDFFGIVGRNGSGKSTLLKTIAGIYEPTAGRVKVNGNLVPFIELGVGFNPNLTGRENVYLNAALLGFSRDETDEMYDDIVDFAELHDFMEERLQNYSSGMQVRLAFSISIRAKGDILLLDEVLAVGDSAFQQKCYDYFDQLKKEGKTVILVTHSMSNVERFCNRGLLLNDGEIDTIGSSEEVAGSYRDLFKTLRQPMRTARAVKNNKIELTSASVVQSGKKVETIQRGEAFSLEFKLKLLDKKYTAHNMSINIRNAHDISVAFLTTIDSIPNCFDVDNEDFNITFSINNNIYGSGRYYVDVSIRSAVQSNKSREVTLDERRVVDFEIESRGNNKSNSLTLPDSIVHSTGIIHRKDLWDSID